MKIILFIFVIYPLALFSQYDYPYEYYNGRYIMRYGSTRVPQRPEILGAESQQMIIDSVHRSLLRYKIKSYASMYNLDSIFPDSLSKASFLQNPYVLEYPKLKGYRLQQGYKVSNISRGELCYYVQGIFGVETLSPIFIRDEDAVKGILPDTIYDHGIITNLCGRLDRNTIVFFHTPTKKLLIMGGCLGVEDLPEGWGYGKRGEIPVEMADVYAQARTAGLGRGSCNTEFDELTFRCGLDSIGSMKVGNIKDGYRFYRLAFRLGCFPDLCRNVSESEIPLAWFIQLRIPKEGEYGSMSHSNRIVVYREPEQWDDVEAIKFTTDENWYKFLPGYVPGFKAYELRIRFKKNPTPADSNIHLRGLTDKEIKELRKIDCLRPFRPGVWDKY
jgi:hypothetical protein